MLHASLRVGAGVVGWFNNWTFAAENGNSNFQLCAAVCVFVCVAVVVVVIINGNGKCAAGAR